MTGRIGILGGVGHAAAAVAHHQAVRRLQESVRPTRDAELPGVIVRSSPPPCTGALAWSARDEAAMDFWLRSEVAELGAQGCKWIIPACVSLRPLITAQEAHDCLRLPDAALRFAELNEVKRLHVLASRLTAGSGWMRDLAREHGISATFPGEAKQRALDGLIGRMIAGAPGRGDAEALGKLIRSAPAGSAVLLACTELSVIWHEPGLRDLAMDRGGPLVIDALGCGVAYACRVTLGRNPWTNELLPPRRAPGEGLGQGLPAAPARKMARTHIQPLPGGTP